MRHGVLAIGLALAAVVACGDADSTDGDASWADEVDAVVLDLADAYDTADFYQTARFFSAGGTLDLSVWGLGVLTTPGQVVEALELLWHQANAGAAVQAWHVFVSPDLALVEWGAYGPDGFQRWMQSYAFGPSGRTASRAFRAVERPFESFQTGESAVDELVDRYIAAWNGDHPDRLADVYAEDAIVRDDMAGEVWRGIDEIQATHSSQPSFTDGPWPRLHTYRDDPGAAPSEAIVVFQVEDECPVLEARRWVFDAGTIVNEVRLTHVPSAHRCQLDSPDGWWSTFELPPELLSNVTEILDVGGNSVELINAEPVQEEFSRWLFDRYTDGGVGIPQVAAIWFPPAPECVGIEGMAISTDERYEGRRTAVVCFSEDELLDDETPSGWASYPAAIGLHELGHIWMVDHVDDPTRDAFVELADLPTWRDPATRWSRRGVEHAAFTLAWGLAGDGDALYNTPPRPTCGQAASRYEVLTSRAPITGCVDDESMP